MTMGCPFWESGKEGSSTRDSVGLYPHLDEVELASAHQGCSHRPQVHLKNMVAPPAPDSPRSSQSPPPDGVQGDLEMELFGLANALYNLGTTVINDSTKERDKPGGGVKQVGLRV